MCIFTSGKDIPKEIRLALRTLQYLVIPLLSLAILVVGALHLGECDIQQNLPVWHIVAGASGLLTPIFYLLFDEINPWLGRRNQGLSEIIDNIVVFLLPLYIIFEVCWLITGSVWLFGITNHDECDRTIYIFSYVVIINFWIHILTPLVFMISLCCTRLFPYCGYCAYWKLVKSAIDNWTRRTRLIICSSVALPLGLSMVIVGAFSVNTCQNENLQLNETTGNSAVFNASSRVSFLHLKELEMIHIPVWLLVAGVAILCTPFIYWIYDKYIKQEDGGPLIKSSAKGLIIFYLLCGLAWSVIGFLWVFGSHENITCGEDSATYQFAFGTLIIMNIIMDIWICFKICVVLYWAFLSDD